MVLVLGSQNSSNSLRLAEIAQACGKPAYLIDGVNEIADRPGSTGDETVLITAGASAPEDVVQECVDVPAAALSARPSRAARCARSTSASRCRASCACW